MRKTLKTIGIILGIFIVIILIGGLFTSKKYHYEKSIEINTTPTKVWDKVNSINKINKWMPFSVINASTLTAFSGKDGEVGSTFTWSGKQNTSSGKITLLNSKLINEDPDESDFSEEFEVKYAIELYNPKKLDAEMVINVESFNKNSIVTWEINNKVSYPLNFIIVNFINKDYLFENEVNQGLTNLKAISEQ